MKPNGFRKIVASVISGVLVLWGAWVSTDLISMERSWAASIVEQENVSTQLKGVSAALTLLSSQVSDIALFHMGRSEVARHECTLAK